jgi:hypothetical protein
MDDLSKLLRENVEYYMTDVHTALSGVVKKYDPATRRADVQPSLKRKLPGGKYLDFPVIPDVPVLFPSSKKYTLHFPLEEGDEVMLITSERGTDSWKAKGGKGIEEADPRRFDLQDCYAIPGLQAVDFIPVSEDGLNIVHKSGPKGELISKITMDDDKIEVNITKGNIIIKNGKDEITMMDGDIDIKSPKPIGINGGGNDLNAGSLTPYWTAENAAFSALDTIVSNPMLTIQLAILDGMSGGLGQVIALGTGLIALCKAVIAEDEAAKSSSKPIIK